MTRFKSSVAACLIAAFTLGATEIVWAQDSVAVARDLYAAAAYEDALVVLNRLRQRERSQDDRRAVEQYRAFCLLALGRAEEAERTIEGIVVAEPFYQPSAADVSPRVRAAFTDVRRRMLPGIVQQKYVQAKAAFDRKEFVAAEAAFQQVLDVLSDPDIRGSVNQSPLSDVRTLSAGFHELSAAAAAPPPPPPPPPVVAAPPPLPVAPRVYGPADPGIVPPSILRQQLPMYPREVPRALRGVMDIIIDEQGIVESAVMRDTVDELYDQVAVASVRNWRYTPATVDGRPVKFRKAIQITLDPKR